LKVAVLKGGRSLERGVSLRSGARVEDALERLGHEVLALEADGDLVKRLVAEPPDVAFVALHGPGGEDGTAQELLEILGIPFTGPGIAACVRCIDKVGKIKSEDEDELIGTGIVRRALEAPIRMIAENAGVDGSIVLDRVKKEKGSFGYNAMSGEYEDLTKSGVIDPTKVVRCAVENAASVASLLLTTEAMVAEIPEKKEKMPPGGGMPGGMPGMM